MARVYKTVRLAYETKVWIDKLILSREKKLKEEMKNGLVDRLETNMQDDYAELLNGVSFNVVLKVSSGSVLEQAYRYCETQKFSDEEWKKIQVDMERTIEENNFQEETSVTPRLYLDEKVLDGLEHYQYHFKSDKPGKRVPRLSYIIKLVVFAFYSQLNSHTAL